MRTIDKVLWLAAVMACLLIIAFALNGCYKAEPYEHHDDYHGRVIEFGYNGHDYIEFCGPGGIGIVHSPDCHCFTDSIKHNQHE